MTITNSLELLTYIFIFFAGVCVGSFINVLIYRIPRGIQFVEGNSFCPECGKRIMPYDLIPVLSYILLKGSCRNCGAHISVKYPLIETFAGGLAIVTAYAFGLGAAALLYFFIFVTMTAISFIDAEHMIIPDGLVLFLAGLSVACVVLGFAGDVSLTSRVIGLFAISLPMFLLTLLIPNAFGGGDIKLFAVFGFLLGYKLVLLTGFIAIMLGGFHGVYVKYIRKDIKAIHIAFGQYICIGSFIAILYGEEIIRLYLSIWF